MFIPHIDFIIPDMERKRHLIHNRKIILGKWGCMHLQKLCNAISQLHSTYLMELPSLLEHTIAWHEKY